MNLAIEILRSKTQNIFKPKSVYVVFAILVFFLFNSCQPKTTDSKADEAQKAKEEKMIELTYTCLDVWSSGNLSLVNEVYSPEIIRHWIGQPDIVGLEAYKNEIMRFKTGFPDIHFEVGELFVRDDKVYYELTLTATNTGPFGDIPPTGKKIKVDIMEIDRIVDDKIVEEWGYMDRLDLLMQLGFTVIPPEEQKN